MTFRPKFLGHVNLYVRDAQRAERFYQEALGLHTYGRRPGSAFLSADMGQAHELAVIEVGPTAPLQEKGQVGLNHIAWKMETFNDLKELHNRLQQMGVAVERVQDHGIALGVYFRDPDGNGNEAYYELPPGEWPEGVPYGTGTEMITSGFPWTLED